MIGIRSTDFIKTGKLAVAEYSDSQLSCAVR